MRYATRIVRGRGEGKRIGFPTLNFEIPAAMNEAPGIYAGKVHWHGAEYPAVFHFGDIPTFGIPDRALEAHVLTAMPEPPENAEVELLQFIRRIEAFPGLTELQEAIRKDVETAKKILGVL